MRIGCVVGRACPRHLVVPCFGLDVQIVNDMHALISTMHGGIVNVTGAFYGKNTDKYALVVLPKIRVFER